MEDERIIEIERDSIEALPTVAELRTLADRYDKVFLRFGIALDQSVHTDDAKNALIERLQSGLPECFVFNSGGASLPTPTSWITIVRAVTTQTVIKNEARLLAALRAFGETATDLITRLAKARGVELSCFLHDPFAGAGEQTGRFDNECGYRFHGYECLFVNEKTGQRLEVIVVGSGGAWGALDPYFFSQFVSSTPEWADVARFLQSAYHGTLRAFDILEARGSLVQMTPPGGVTRLYLAPHLR